MQESPLDPPPLAVLELVLPAVAQSIGPARRAVSELAEASGAAGPRLGEIALAVSEACTNVVVHAYREGPPGHLRVTAQIEAAHLSVCVIDTGVGMGARVDSPGLGLGLPTIAALASRFEVRPGPAGGGTTLRMCFLLDPLRAPRGPISVDVI